MRNLSRIGLWTLALLLALWLVHADSRSDDTGITAGLVLLFAAAFSFARPERPWLWGLFWGLSFPVGYVLLAALAGKAPTAHVAESLLALVPAFLGAYGGAALRRFLSPAPPGA
jgi:hypothetical protein